ncbi:MAG: membrane protein insertase YidC [Planctomycetes bacterium]|nr:membrane protein insertase YidC [Planctomycetota bacterium]
MLRLLLLSLCLLSPALFAAETAVEPAVATTATKIVAAPAGKKLVTLRNEMAEIAIDIEWAEITDFRLLDHKPLALDEALGGDSTLDPSGPLSVLGPFHPDYAGHNAIIFEEDAPWTLAASSDSSVSLQRNVGDLLYTLTYTLNAKTPRVESLLRIDNQGAEKKNIKPEITVINGVHQDSARQDAYYNGLFVYEEEDLVALDVPTLPAKNKSHGKIVTRDVSNVDYVSVRSRFFAAMWSFEGVTSESKSAKEEVADEDAGEKVESVKKPKRSRSVLNASEEVAETGEANVATVMMLSGAFPGGPKIARQHQIFVNVVISGVNGKSFVINPGESYNFKWKTTVTSMRKSDLAHLTEPEQDLEYSSVWYRFFRMFSNILLWMMNIIYVFFVAIGLESVAYGLAVMGVTVVVKGLMHRLTYKQQYSMMKMQQLGPELRRLQAQYKDDRQAMAMKQMELWKKNGVNPLGGCLPMLIQMPIFIALFQAFSHAGDLRGHGFFWVIDLTLQDQTIPLGFNWPFLDSPASINLLPMVYLPVALFQSLSMKMTAPSSGDKQKDDMQASMQKMFRFMPIFFFVFIYFFPAGLVLYITISSLWSLIEIRMIRKSLGLDEPKNKTTTVLEADKDKTISDAKTD